MVELNRFKKIVKPYGSSKIILMYECSIGDEVYVFTQEELNILLRNNIK